MAAGSRNQLDLLTHALCLARTSRSKAEHVCQFTSNLNPKTVLSLEERNALYKAADVLARVLAVVGFQCRGKLRNSVAMGVGRVGVEQGRRMRPAPLHGPGRALTRQSPHAGWQRADGLAVGDGVYKAPELLTDSVPLWRSDCPRPRAGAGSTRR